MFQHRPLDPAGIPRVLALYRAAILPTWLANRRDHDFDRIEANIRDRLGDPGYHLGVAELPGAGELAAYIAWERHPDHTSRHTVAHLRMILVHPDHQGSGLGAELMARFEADARAAGCTKVLFDVVVGSAARTFYEHMGYRHWSDYLEKVLDEA